MGKPGAKDKNDYKLVVSDLGVCPFRKIRIAFALMALIPLLVVFYIILGKYFLFQIVLGNDALTLCIAILISLTGLFYAYSLVGSMVEKLLKYAADRRLADNEKTELMISVSHDLKTPLSVIKMSLRNIVDFAGEAYDGTLKVMLSHCLKAVDKMSELVSEILEFPKTGLTRTNIKRELVDMNAILKKEIDNIAQLVKRNGIDLKHKISTENAGLWADKNKISRVVTNLLSNAVKYTPSGGRISAVLSSDADTIQLSIVNTGPGIPPQDLDRIFKRYERLEEHSRIEGTGIGLSIVKDIVDLHSGRITVRSQPDKETEFNIILPRDLRSRSAVVTRS